MIVDRDPFAYGGIPDECGPDPLVALGGGQDAVDLSAAERELTEVHERRKACPDDDLALWEKLCCEEDRLEDQICTTPPAAMVDCVVKLRLLRHPDLGIEARDFFDIHATALDQVCEFIERQIGSAVP